MQRLLLCIPLALLCACSNISPRKLTNTFVETEQRFHDHTGFMLYDLDARKTMFEYNADKYFTPASNTKIFTFFTALTTLGDSLPALKFTIAGDSLTFWGTGDPSLLYKNVYDNGRVLHFLKTVPQQLYFSPANFGTTHFGAGWAWDDYNTEYSPERSPLPIYGNIFTLTATPTRVDIQPPLLRSHLTVGPTSTEGMVTRALHSNDITYNPPPGNTYQADVPFTVDAQLITAMLADTLKRTVTLVNKPLPASTTTFYSMPADSVYRVMMQASDNFIAEQLLMMAAATLSDTLQPEIAIRHMLKNELADLPDKPEWVDGSGLSRYNLFTPRSVVKLWEKIYAKVPRERLFPLLATGGKPGTLRNWYRADKPYVFGKTGSLSNNHCLSGYLVTKKGKTVIFSFMNSNYVAPSVEIRRNMQSILNQIYEHY